MVSRIFSYSLSLYLHFLFKLAEKIKSFAHYAKGKFGTLLKCFKMLVDFKFQVLFHSPLRVLFTLSLTVLFHYRSYKVFKLLKVVLQSSTFVYFCYIDLAILLKIHEALTLSGYLIPRYYFSFLCPNL